ncbi:MAG: diaminopimelate dehydrogenase, partial [Oscillospiraceae bacterium]|nr:diaminopimelate dehydrogenase [Oscillospiraceae bacterium]
MKKIAAIGAGNVGIMAAKALELSQDMELCGFVRKNIKPVPGFENLPVAKSVFDLPEKPDGAIICIPSRMVEETEKELLEAGIYTVDAFDIHEEILDLRGKLSAAARKGKSAAIIGAGW